MTGSVKRAQDRRTGDEDRRRLRRARRAAALCLRRGALSVVGGGQRKGLGMELGVSLESVSEPLAQR